MSKYEGKAHLHMASDSQEHESPDEIFNPLNKEFRFKIDLCASKKNAKLSRYYTKEDDCFTKDWDETSWANIEFKYARRYIKKAYYDSLKFKSTLVILCTVKSNTNWWADWVMKSKEVRFIKDKVYFKGEKNTQGLRFPCAIVVFGPHRGVTKFSIFIQDKVNNDT